MMSKRKRRQYQERFDKLAVNVSYSMSKTTGELRFASRFIHHSGSVIHQSNFDEYINNLKWLKETVDAVTAGLGIE